MIVDIIKNFAPGKKAKLIFLFLFTILGGMLSIVPIKCMQRMVDLAILRESKYLKTVIVLGMVYMILQIVSNTLRYYAEYLVSYFQYEIGSCLQINVYKKLMRVDLQQFQKHDSVKLTNVLIEDTEFICNNIMTPLSKLLLLVTTFTCGLYYMIHINWLLTCLILPLGLITSLSSRFIQTKTMNNIEQKREASNQLWKTFSEGIRGVVPLQICHAHQKYQIKVTEDSRKMKELNNKQSRLENTNECVVSILFMLTIGFMLLLSCIFVIKGDISIGSLTAILMYNHMLVDPLVELLDVQQAYIKLKVSLGRINKIMELPEKTDSPIEAVDQIVVKQVSYKYEKEDILQNVNLNIETGQKVAIIGETGSGKSTFVNVVAGLLTPSQGEVRYIKDGKQVKGVPDISYLYQDGYLFDWGVRENIILANPSISNEEYRAIVEACCLENVVSGHKDSIGENGSKLSGGERKRIRIARTLANKRADIYIFDELSTSLDSEMSMKITQNVLKMLQGKMCIFIEHNMDVAAKMDKIIMVEKGAVLVRK